MSKNIARDGAAKRLTPPNAHDGMHHRSRDGQLVVGRTDHAPVASGGLVTSAFPGKAHVQPGVAGNDRHRANDAAAGSHPGDNLRAATRAVDHELSKRILDEAYAAGSHQDRQTRRTFVPTK